MAGLAQYQDQILGLVDIVVGMVGLIGVGNAQKTAAIRGFYG
jgi:hypothetical protein